MGSENGLLVRHRSRGIGKIAAFDQNRIRVRFADGSEADFTKNAVANGDLERTWLPAGARCLGSDGECEVVRREEGDPGSTRSYEVQYEKSGLKATLTELDLIPLPESAESDPIALLSTGHVDDYALFRSREALEESLNRILRGAGGLRALISSRIDLLPHHAYVAGVILRDWRPRYILADEVGLGKTIEACVVIHDLLSKKPDARVLIICPGTLTQQWLSEIYSKFGGQVFTLLDLHDPNLIDPSKLNKVIVSTTLALQGTVGNTLNAIAWDMLVVDEAHHILASETLYSMVQSLSRIAPEVLLISAIPVQRREKELLQLLSLLEPERYRIANRKDVENFSRLYAAQSDVGRRLRLLNARIAGMISGEYTGEDVLNYARRLLELPILSSDSALQNAVNHEAHMIETWGMTACWSEMNSNCRFRFWNFSAVRSKNPPTAMAPPRKGC